MDSVVFGTKKSLTNKTKTNTYFSPPRRNWQLRKICFSKRVLLFSTFKSSTGFPAFKKFCLRTKFLRGNFFVFRGILLLNSEAKTIIQSWNAIILREKQSSCSKLKTFKTFLSFWLIGVSSWCYKLFYRLRNKLNLAKSNWNVAKWAYQNQLVF